MTAAPQQLAIGFSNVAQLDRASLIVHRGNAAAVQMIESWPNWTAPALIISAPPFSGKSHLATIWASMAKANFVSNDFRQDQITAISRNNSIIENANQISDCNAFLHLINHCAEIGTYLLLTAPQPPINWAITLPDLASRLQAMPLVAITEADDATLTRLILKLFAARQIPFSARQANWVVANMERTNAAIFNFVEQVDQLSLALGTQPNAKLIRQIVGLINGASN